MNRKQISTVCPECEIGSLTRNNYFTGKLLVERDFKDEQRYYIDKLRLHQKRLHGEGVVCGLEVKQHPSAACQARYVCVGPGFAKDCCGNDIVVPEEDCIDITHFKSWRALQAAQNNQPASSKGAAADPGITASHTLQICVRYRECPTENIPVLYDDCGCDDTACAPNRILESYELDLQVDPDLKIKSGCLPGLVAGKALNGVAAIALAYDPTDAFLYAISSGSPATLFQMDPSGQNIIAQFILPGTGKAVTVSDDGKLVYVVSFSSGSQQSSLVVLNSSGLTVAGTSTAISDDSAPASLAALPASQVVWLQNQGAQLMVWDASTATPTQVKTIALTGSPSGLVLGGDRSKGYYIDSANHQVGVVDVAGGATSPPLAQVSNPAQVILASSSGPDVLAVIDSINATITAVQASPATVIANIALMNQPLAAAADPQKRVLYLVSKEAGSSPPAWELQTFDLRKLVAGSPELPPAGIPSIPPSAPTSVVTDAHYVFVVAAVSNNVNNQGFQIDTPRCPDLYELEECDDCCTADCLVLATIRGYQPGFLIEDPTTPPSDPLTDYNNHIARIDNRLGREILPSTRRIAEVLESIVCGCACECEGQPAPAPAPPQPVTGLNPGLPKIIDIGWQHGATLSWDDFHTAQFQSPPTTIDTQPYPLLTIYFNDVMTGVDRQSFRVEVTYPDVTGTKGKNLAFSGLYGSALLYGDIVDLAPAGGITTPHTLETAKSAWAFLPYPDFWNNAGLRGWWLGETYVTDPWPTLDLPCVRVTLSGDFVYAGSTYAESGVLDGNNIGGQVGLNETRGGSITGGKNPSGDMTEGGTFESWFYLQAPGAQQPTNKVNVNQATPADLRTLPGVTAAFVKTIVAERQRQNFKDLKDFQSRVGLSADAAKGLASLITF